MKKQKKQITSMADFNLARKYTTGKSKYTRVLHRRVIKSVRAGNDGHVAAIAAGITRATFKAWQWDFNTKGKKSRYWGLFKDIDEAEQAFEEEMVAVIRAGTKEDPKWAIEYLKRKKKDRWSDRTAIELSGPNGGPIVSENIRERFKAKIEAIRSTKKSRK